MAQLPPWLIAARGASEGATVAAPNTEVEHACPRPGDIRAAGAMDAESDGHRRLVCVLEVDAEYGFATVALLTNEVDLAAADDVLVRRDTTGAAFDLLLQLGIVAPVWWAQLGPALGSVPLDEVANDPELRSAMPLRREDDIRWAFKESELRDLQLLAADCARTVIDEPETAIVPEVDPELVAECLAGRDSRIALLLEPNGRPRCAPLRLRPAIKLSETDDRSLGPDVLTVLHTVLNESLRSEEAVGSPSATSEIKWSPSRRAGSSAVDEVVNARAERRIRTMRLITGPQFWATEERLDYCAARTAHGLVQVLPEDL